MLKTLAAKKTVNRLGRAYQDLRNFPKSISPEDCVHVATGAYATMDMQEPYAHMPRALFTGGLMECVGVLACVKDLKGNPIRWGLAHLTIGNDPASTINDMDRALRHDDPTFPISFDLVGGDEDFGEGHEGYSGADLARDVRKTALRRPNATVNDHLFDERYINLAVDLSTGRKYASVHQPSTTLLCAEEMQRTANTPYLSEHITEHYTTWAKALQTKKQLPATRFRWEFAMPELKQLWSSPEAERVRTKVAENYTDSTSRIV